MWPYGSWRIGVNGDVVVKFLEEIPTKGLTYADRNDLMEKLRNIAARELQGAEKSVLTQLSRPAL